ncbi:MAG: protein translocase subunit SecF [Spirochaetales bacterium]|nr:protein translocase subunit SecF [Spirochaetales bacterium]
MAKKIYPITKFRFYVVALSALLLIVGVVFFFVKGFNLSIDFQSGFSQRVQIAPAALSVTYDGEDTVTLNVSGGTVTLVKRDMSGANYFEFATANYATAGQLAEAINSSVSGVTVVALEPNLPSTGLITGFGLPATLGDTPFVLNRANTDSSNYVSIDEMRRVVGDGAQIQVVGDDYKQIFQIRLTNDDNLSQEAISQKLSDTLKGSFDSASIVVLQSDFVGPRYSSTLVSGSILIIVVSIVLILIYVWFRFKLAYALAAIITLVHDTFLLIGFIVVAQLEVSSTTIAALLTIIGYALNNVIVIFDRIRENRGFLKDISLMELIDTSVSQSLSRTLFSSLTTALAILPLAILASGAIQLFAIEMVFGIVIGAYSSNLLAPSLLMWITRSKEEKAPAKVTKAVEAETAPTASEGEEVATEEVEIPVVERKLKGKRQQKK